MKNTVLKSISVASLIITLSVAAAQAVQTSNQFNLEDFLSNGSRNAQNHVSVSHSFSSSSTAIIPEPVVDPAEVACNAKPPFNFTGGCPNKDRYQTTYKWEGGMCKATTVRLGMGSGCK